MVIVQLLLTPFTTLKRADPQLQVVSVNGVSRPPITPHITSHHITSHHIRSHACLLIKASLSDPHIPRPFSKLNPPPHASLSPVQGRDALMEALMCPSRITYLWNALVEGWVKPGRALTEVRTSPPALTQPHQNILS